MNWFTTSDISGRSVEAKKELAEEDSCCEHVEQDPSVAVACMRENDSFGPVSTYVCCQACLDKAEEAEGEEEVVCDDCQKTVKKKNSYEWKWYDFYAAQGDEPLVICDDCRKAPKHQARIKKDREDCEEEMSRYDD